MQAMSAYEEMEDRQSVHICATNASYLATRLGQYRSAYELATRAVGLAAELDPLLEAKSRTNRGLACRYLNLFDEAADEYRRALDIHLSLGNDEGVARNRSNLAVVDLHRGRYRSSFVGCQEALRLCESHEGEPWANAERRSATVNLASVLELMGQVESAFELYDSLLSEPDVTQEERAFILMGAGRVHLKLGDAGEAERLLEEAREIHEKTGDRGSLANTLQHLGVLRCERFGDHDGAQALLRDALGIASALEDRQELLYDLLHLGRCALHTGDTEAGDIFLRAEKMADELSSPEGVWIARYGLGRCEDLVGRPEAALQDYLAALDIIEDMRQDAVPERFRATFLGDTGFFWDKLDVVGAAVGDLLEMQSELRPDAARVSRAFALLERFTARSLLERLGGRPLSLDDLRERLAEDEVVVEFLLESQRIVVFVVSRKKVADVVIECPAVVHEAMRGLLHGYDDGRGKGVEKSDGDPVSECVLRPILAEIPPGTRRLVIATSTNLASLPWSALTDPHTGKPLGERFEIAIIPSASVLAAIRAIPERKRGIDFVGLGDPVLVSTGGATGKSIFSGRELLEKKHGLKALPWARQELRIVASQIGGSQELLVGAEAAVPGFLGSVERSPRILHLATHAVVDVSLPHVAAIILSPDILSDGLLWEEEIARLEIPVDLVVLASCRSARGRVIRGEGVIGLARAFLEAGARSVVCTLAEVGDQASASFMHAFYSEVSRGSTVGHAVQAAQRGVSAGGRFFSDAPFILVGDPSVRVVEGRDRTVVRLVVSMGAGAAVFLGILLGFRRRRSLRRAALADSCRRAG